MSNEEGPAVEAPKRSARKYALWLLGRREWAEKELRERLRHKGYETSAVDDCLDFCKTHGLQCDDRYGTSRVRTRAVGRGNRQVRDELSRQGIDSEVVERALAEAGEESTRALVAVRRFEGQALDVALRNKVWRYLTSRGFSGSSVKVALDHLRVHGAHGLTPED